ncbi:MAG TPA: aldo/keto reductase [Mycobacteriales bacterium]|nr:aldo/keto reductase [Mycobacteriales bacterium]
MQTRRVGSTGLTVSRLGLGTMTWGRGTDATEAAEQLANFRAAGGTLVDTSAGYGGGAAEQILGEVLGSAPADDLVLATKAGISGRTGERVVDTSRRALLDALDASLHRLGRDHIDLWQVHAWGDAPLEETLSALDFAVSSGRARYVGISNFNGWQTAAAASWQRAWPGRTPLATTQMEYSLLRRGVEADLIPACRHLGLGLLAWSPLAGGVLTGKYTGGVPTNSRGASAEWGPRVASYLDDRAGAVVDAVRTAADGLEVSPLAVALAWVRDRPGVASAVVGARTAAQLSASLEAERLELPPAISAALDDVSG